MAEGAEEVRGVGRERVGEVQRGELRRRDWSAGKQRGWRRRQRVHGGCGRRSVGWGRGRVESVRQEGLREAKVVELRSQPSVKSHWDSGSVQLTRCRETPPQLPSEPRSSGSSQTIATTKKPFGRLKLPSHPFSPSSLPTPQSEVRRVRIDAASSATEIFLDGMMTRRSRRTSRSACCTLGRARSRRSRMSTCGRRRGVGVGLGTEAGRSLEFLRFDASDG